MMNSGLKKYSDHVHEVREAGGVEEYKAKQQEQAETLIACGIAGGAVCGIFLWEGCKAFGRWFLSKFPKPAASANKHPNQEPKPPVQTSGS